MQLSYKIRRLLVMSIGIVILALSAQSGLDESEREFRMAAAPTFREKLSIDPSAFELAASPSPQVASVAVPAKVAPEISAEAYLVAHLETGEIYSELNASSVFAIASLSKLITAVVALRSMSPDQKITVTQAMLDAYGPAGNLQLGDTLSVSELLPPMLLESSNDSAEAIALSHGYPEFIEKMNVFVKEIGMTSTSFGDPSGMSPSNTSNARDLLTLARYLYDREQSLLALTRLPSYSIASTTEHGEYVWRSINPFPHDPHFIGGKTGRTNEAKESMISLFRYLKGDVAYPVAVIVLRSEFSSRELDTSVLLSRFIKKIEAR